MRNTGAELRILSTDILVIGAGGAGLRAALSAHDAAPDLKILVVSRGKPGAHGVTATACSDRMAFHVSFPFTPPAGALAWREHAKDIYEGGGHVSDPNLANLLAEGSADAYQRLAELGVPFALGPGSRPRQFMTDGSTHPRACYTGPYTARDIEDALLRAARKAEIELLGDLMLCSLLKDEGSPRLSGALFVSEVGGEWLAVAARSVILATGGPGEIFEENVYPGGMNAAGWHATIVAGAALVNLEFIQFGLSSPATSLACSGSLMRALPAITADGRDLLEDVRKLAPDRNPIELLFMKGASWPVSAESPALAVDLAVWRAVRDGRTARLDYRSNPPFADADFLNARMSEIVRTWYKDRGVLLARNGSLSRPIERLRGINPQVIDWFRDRGIDLEREPIEVRHAAQHFQGGVLINTMAETGVPGLYACGEVAGGQHGANRPGGNSLLDCQVMGHVAGNEAARWAYGAALQKIDETARAEAAALESHLIGSGGREAHETIQAVREALSKYAGIVRTRDGLATAEKLLIDLMNAGVNTGDSGLPHAVSARAAVVAGLAIVRAAAARPESRGSHLYFNSEEDTQPLARNDAIGRAWNAVTWAGKDVLVQRMEIPPPRNRH